MRPLTNKLFAYVRCSTVGQTDENHISLDTQIDHIQRYLTEQGDDRKVEIVREIGSARNPEKLRALGNLLGRVNNGDTILVHRFDRFSRNLVFGAQKIKELFDRGIRVISVTQPLDYATSFGRSYLNTILNQAEYESHNRGEIVRQTFQSIRNAGGVPHRPPYGTTLKNPQPKRTREEINQMLESKAYVPPDRSLKSVLEEQRNIEMVKGLRLGTLTLDEINAHMTAVHPEFADDPIVVEGPDGKAVEKTEPNALSYANIADIMNLYEMPYRPGIRWSAPIIKRLVLDQRVTSIDPDCLNSLIDERSKRQRMDLNPDQILEQNQDLDQNQDLAQEEKKTTLRRSARLQHRDPDPIPEPIPEPPGTQNLGQLPEDPVALAEADVDSAATPSGIKYLASIVKNFKF